MAAFFDIVPIIGGILLCLSLLVIGIALIRRKERQRGLLFFLAGLALSLIVIKTFFLQE